MNITFKNTHLTSFYEANIAPSVEDTLKAIADSNKETAKIHFEMVQNNINVIEDHLESKDKLKLRNLQNFLAKDIQFLPSFKNENLMSYYEENLKLSVQFLVDAIATSKLKTANHHFKSVQEYIHGCEKKQILGYKGENKEELLDFENLLKGEIDRLFEEKVAQTKNPPIGLINRGNNCWANSFIQLFANAPNMVRKILNSTDQVLKETFEGYFDAQRQGRVVDVATPLREKITNQDEIDQEIPTQEDPNQGLEYVFAQIGPNHTFTQEYHIPLDENQVFSEKSEMKSNEQIRLELSSGKRSFSELMKDFFSSPTNRNPNEIRKYKFEAAPEDLMIQANRTGWNLDGSTYKISYPIENIEQTLHLPKEYLAEDENATYELKGCIIHSPHSTTIESGHYFTLVKKQDGWYKANDFLIEKLTDEEAQHYLSYGCIFHYAKVDSPMEVVHTQPQSREEALSQPQKPMTDRNIEVEEQSIFSVYSETAYNALSLSAVILASSYFGIL